MADHRVPVSEIKTGPEFFVTAETVPARPVKLPSSTTRIFQQEISRDSFIFKNPWNKNFQRNLRWAILIKKIYLFIYLPPEQANLIISFQK